MKHLQFPQNKRRWFLNKTGCYFFKNLEFAGRSVRRVYYWHVSAWKLWQLAYWWHVRTNSWAFWKKKTTTKNKTKNKQKNKKLFYNGTTTAIQRNNDAQMCPKNVMEWLNDSKVDSDISGEHLFHIGFFRFYMRTCWSSHVHTPSTSFHRQCKICKR